MKYKVGEKVRFSYDEYEYYYNTDLEYVGTVELKGTIIAIREDNEIPYVIEATNGIVYYVEEKDIISSEREEKLKEVEKQIIDKKLEIADISIRMRNAIWDDHPAHLKESKVEYEKAREEWYDAISEYDDLEDRLIMLVEK